MSISYVDLKGLDLMVSYIPLGSYTLPLLSRSMGSEGRILMEASLLGQNV